MADVTSGKMLEDIYAHLEMLTEFAAAMLEALAETHPGIVKAYEERRVPLGPRYNARVHSLVQKLKRES